MYYMYVCMYIYIYIYNIIMQRREGHGGDDGVVTLLCCSSVAALLQLCFSSVAALLQLCCSSIQLHHPPPSDQGEHSYFFLKIFFREILSYAQLERHTYRDMYILYVYVSIYVSIQMSQYVSLLFSSDAALLQLETRKALLQLCCSSVAAVA